MSLASIASIRFELFLAFGYAFGLFLLLSSYRRDLGGIRVLNVTVIPFVAGLLLIALLLTSYFAQTINAFGIITSGLQPIAGSVVAIFVSIAVAELLLTRLADIAAYVSQRIQAIFRRTILPSNWVLDLSRVAFFGVSIAVVMIVASELRPVAADLGSGSANSGGKAVIEASFSLPGAPTALVFRGDNNGYLALGEGQILSFELSRSTEGWSVEWDTVAEDIMYPHGLGIIDDTLFVTDQGPFDCVDEGAAGAFAGIRCAKFQDMTLRDSQIKMLTETRGSVLAFDILPDGTLENRRAILSDLPIASGDHGVNAAVAGPDGRLYVTVGGLDSLANEPDMPDIIEGIERPNKELSGTVLAIEPDGSDFDVFASGLRNVYDLTFDEEGRLYGVDNSGVTSRDWRLEEVLHIKRGARYGHPFVGTYGLGELRDDPPLWVIDGAGSAGVEWAEKVGLQPGILIGSLNQVEYLALDEGESGVFVGRRGNSITVFEPGGFVPVVEAGPEGRLVVGVFGFRPGKHFMYLLDVSQISR